MAAEYGSISPAPDLEFDDRLATVGIPRMKVLLQAISKLRELISHYKKMLRVHNGGGGGGGPCRHDHGGHLYCGAGHDAEGHDGHISYPCHLGTGGGGAGSGGRTSFVVGALTDAPLERIRFLLKSATVYFATLGFIDTIIARNVRGGSNETRSIITYLAKNNHVFFQMFTLVNIFGFATSSGALLIRVDKGKLKSGGMFLTCSIIASLCMALSFSVLVFVCVLVSLDALAVTGFNG